MNEQRLTPRTRGTRSLWGRLSILLFGFALGGCTVATPFRGPATDGASAGRGHDRVIVAMTHAVLGPDDDLRASFWHHVAQVEATLPAQPGFLGHSKRVELFGDQAWTMTVWRDAASLRAFVRSPAHRKAIRGGYDAVTSARFAQVEMKREAIPLSWEEALELLAQHGRDDGEG
jgi:heme-degrading monooxygenase HmoA